MPKDKGLSAKISLVRADSLAELVRGLYLERKRANPKVSLEFFARRAGLPSKGYLGDIMKGRRRLPEKHARSLAETFELHPTERRLLSLLARADFERNWERRAKLLKRIRALRVQLEVGESSFPRDLPSRLLFARVFCALGVFPQAPHPEDIVRLLSDAEPTSVKEALNRLLEGGFVKQSKGRLRPTGREFVFGPEDDRGTNVAFILECMNLAGKRAPHWYPHSEESYFESSILSVKRAQYREALPKIRRFFDETQSDLETLSGADDLVYFNIQIFPER